jgi:hypothetical protein
VGRSGDRVFGDARFGRKKTGNKIDPRFVAGRGGDRAPGPNAGQRFEIGASERTSLAAA